MSDALVRVEHVVKAFRDEGNSVEVLRDVSFTLTRGDMAALLGVSGAGKTTLLQILGGLDVADRGSVVVDGREVSALRAAELSVFRSGLIGFVFQFHHLLPDFTALENVFIPGLIAGRKRKACIDRAQDLLQSVGLANRVNHYPSELSGGERQRVALARALFNEPALVLADEPTGNLDSSNGEHLLELFRKMNKERGQTFLVATHNERLAEGLGTTVVLEDGRVVGNAA